MSHPRQGRRKPYTVRGIRTRYCYRCGDQAEYQWQACADNRLFRPLCVRCDVELNALVLRWMEDPDAEDKIRHYAKMKGIQLTPAESTAPAPPSSRRKRPS